MKNKIKSMSAAAALFVTGVVTGTVLDLPTVEARELSIPRFCIAERVELSADGSMQLGYYAKTYPVLSPVADGGVPEPLGGPVEFSVDRAAVNAFIDSQLMNPTKAQKNIGE